MKIFQDGAFHQLGISLVSSDLLKLSINYVK